MIDQICFSDIFMDSAKEIFETMIFMDLMESDDPDHMIDGKSVLGSITFKGELEGCLSICCDEDCAGLITMNMLGIDDAGEITADDTCDAIGEVCNMIMGCVKKRLHDTYANIELSIPLVVNGRQLTNNLGEGTQHVMEKVIIEDEHHAELSFLYKHKANTKK